MEYDLRTKAVKRNSNVSAVGVACSRDFYLTHGDVFAGEFKGLKKAKWR